MYGKITGYKRSRTNKNRYNAKSIARAKLYDYGYARGAAAVNSNAAVANAVLANAGLQRQGFRPIGISKELKVFDMGDQLAVAGNLLVKDMTFNGFVQPIFIPKLGSDFNNRIGRKCVLKSVYLKWRCFPNYVEEPQAAIYNAAFTQPQTMVRVLLVWDTNPNGVIPEIEDILQKTSTNVPDPFSFINMNNRDRFRILLDKVHQFTAIVKTNQSTTSIGSNQTWNGKKFKKLNLETIFNSTSAGTIGDISSGALYLCGLGTENNGEGNIKYSIGEFNTRIRYDDS
uniref:Putative capsid n=1 Tax=uncultured virus TaxID=340016 RepID=A0A1D8MJV4_9VIRU|nr:putative capsid [uncultured virus]